VDGLADYFQRLADYESPEPTVDESETDTIHDHSPTEGEDDSDSAEEEETQRARIAERGGRVNVANPRTPGGRLVPSRSLEIERPAFNLSMAGVVRRGE
jgi:arrestin-related trafficking adapter 3/6